MYFSKFPTFVIVISIKPLNVEALTNGKVFLSKLLSSLQRIKESLKNHLFFLNYAS